MHEPHEAGALSTPCELGQSRAGFLCKRHTNLVCTLARSPRTALTCRFHYLLQAILRFIKQPLRQPRLSAFTIAENWSPRDLYLIDDEKDWSWVSIDAGSNG